MIQIVKSARNTKQNRSFFSLSADSISPTCAHIRSNNANRSSGFYFISPQRKQEIQTEVYCNFDNNQTGMLGARNLFTRTNVVHVLHITFLKIVCQTRLIIVITVTVANFQKCDSRKTSLR